MAKKNQFEVKKLLYLSSSKNQVDEDTTYYNVRLADEGDILEPSVSPEIYDKVSKLDPQTRVNLVFELMGDRFKYNKPKIRVVDIKPL